MNSLCDRITEERSAYMDRIRTVAAEMGLGESLDEIFSQELVSTRIILAMYGAKTSSQLSTAHEYFELAKPHMDDYTNSRITEFYLDAIDAKGF